MNYYELTNIGNFRHENQDTSIVLHTKKITFAAICDGMGGHKGGKQASQLTILAMKKTFKKWTPNNVEESRTWIKDAFNLAKKLMKKEAIADDTLYDMGTTVTCLFIYDDSSWIFNVGDSRIYVFNNEIHQITDDHNLMNHYIKYEGMEPDKAKKIRGASALTSALGPTKQIRVSQYELVDLRNRNVKYFILTSDGVHDYIGKSTFEVILTSTKSTLQEKCKKIIEESINGGSHDNLTIVILEYK